MEWKSKVNFEKKEPKEFWDSLQNHLESTFLANPLPSLKCMYL